MNLTKSRHAQAVALSVVGCGIRAWSIDSGGIHLPWNLIAKLFIDTFWYCVILFLVDDPIYHLIGRKNEDCELVEVCALQHLMEAMICDTLVTVNVAFHPELFKTWTRADLEVQVASFFILIGVSLLSQIPLQLEKERLSLKNVIDLILKCIIIALHSAALLHGSV
jgi:hypothetical protein